MGFWREHTSAKFQIPTCCGGACVRRTNGEFAPLRDPKRAAASAFTAARALRHPLSSTESDSITSGSEWAAACCDFAYSRRSNERENYPASVGGPEAWLTTNNPMVMIGP